ncbi:uncharacterized protein N0V89_002140 [Didymosphaeria variabile]|uniref:Uncharacterized protein n=1 Tax=Didymosphaeria variabile TaxID=1932322 RepID=A0A9W9CE94_9PLEO|nr:uncharacterized protein N0V89_002140 [Didymosphaeria variabile]KAJ4357564.1 hypothetical protein N0V89_002140 [Didymosphaeria variabile]
MSTSPAANHQASDDPADADTLTCKACSRTLATISAEGDLIPHGKLDEGCTLCKDMVMHYNEYKHVQGLFKELETRRDNYGPRQLALEAVHEAQMKWGNFIQSVAAWDHSESEEEGLPEEQAEEQPEKQTHAETAEDANAQPPHRKRSLSPQSSPGPRKLKRPRLSGHSRRVSFDPSVVFRDAEAREKRIDAEFSRNSDGYWPGRYAAPEGRELLDTSGSSMTETKFFGVQKRGKGWVPTKEGLEMDAEWETDGRDEDAPVAREGESDGVAKTETKEIEGALAQRHESLTEGSVRQEQSRDIEMSNNNGSADPNLSAQKPVPDLDFSSGGATNVDEDLPTDERQSRASIFGPFPAKEGPRTDSEELLKVTTTPAD